jgi:hypothetical protein
VDDDRGEDMSVDAADQRLAILHDAWMLMNHWPDSQLY